MRHRLIIAAAAAGGSLVLLAGTALAATPTWTVVPSVNPSATTLSARRKITRMVLARGCTMRHRFHNARHRGSKHPLSGVF